MGYHQSIEGCLESAIGANGLTPSAYSAQLDRLGEGIDILRRHHREGTLALLKVPDARDDLTEAEAAYETLIAGAETVVFFGTGGSSLGGQTVAQLGGWFIPGDGGRDGKPRPRVRFYDNLDPRTLERALASFDLERTRFVVTSKSGGTAETLIQTFAAFAAIKQAGLEARLSDLFLGITEPAMEGKTNGLRDLFAAHGIAMLEHDTGIGGRFSGLTNVGMLPAIALGLDPVAFRQGAGAVLDALLTADGPEACAPAVGAAVAVALAEEKGIEALVMLPYTDRLQRFSHWYVQLWAESLGKGGAGTTPVAALGPVDQHSQLQLWLDGPRKHMVTVFRLACQGTGPRSEGDLARMAGADYLADRTVGDLVAAQQRAIPEALIEAGRPVRTIDMEELDEATLGGLMMHFMLETILAAHLLGVDPFDQPAVEAGKRLTRGYLEAH